MKTKRSFDQLKVIAFPHKYGRLLFCSYHLVTLKSKFFEKDSEDGLDPSSSIENRKHREVWKHLRSEYIALNSTILFIVRDTNETPRRHAIYG